VGYGRKGRKRLYGKGSPPVFHGLRRSGRRNRSRPENRQAPGRNKQNPMRRKLRKRNMTKEAYLSGGDSGYLYFSLSALGAAAFGEIPDPETNAVQVHLPFGENISLIPWACCRKRPRANLEPDEDNPVAVGTL